MLAREDERLNEITHFVREVSAIEFYVRQYGSEVVVKEQATAAKASLFRFGLKDIYLFASDGIFYRITTMPKILRVEQQHGIPFCVWMSRIEKTQIALSHECDAEEDMDIMRRRFPPEVPLESVLQFIVAKGIPHVYNGNDIVIRHRSSPSESIGRLILRDNLWHLQLDGSELMRIDNLLVLELVFELENLVAGGAASAIDALQTGYCARFVGQ